MPPKDRATRTHRAKSQRRMWCGGPAERSNFPLAPPGTEPTCASCINSEKRARAREAAGKNHQDWRRGTG
jgi:hypothetical protein